jgi:hypothetical protein
MTYHGGRVSVIMAGGRGATLLDDTWTWDGITNGWTELTGQDDIFGDRTGHRMAYDPIEGAIVLFGGCTGGCSAFGDGPGDAVVDDTWSLNGGSWGAKTNGTDPTSRCCGGTANFDSASFDAVVYYGGQNVANPGGFDTFLYLWDWNGSTHDGAWVKCQGTNGACP